MAFPEAPRVLYELNPLHEVICQLRFPPVLRIETEVPSGFQERIRASFPYYEAKPSLKLPAGLPPDVVSSFSRGSTITRSASGRKLRFWSAMGILLSVNLTLQQMGSG